MNNKIKLNKKNKKIGSSNKEFIGRNPTND